MRLFRLAGRSSEDTDPRTFTGDARLTRMTGVSDTPAVNAYRVAFKPSARTAWHTHSGPQLLVVLSGRCRVQRAGGPVEIAAAGDVVSIEPDERHWHGADREEPMTHLAINIDATTTWLHKVSDAEYDG